MLFGGKSEYNIEAADLQDIIYTDKPIEAYNQESL